MKLAVPIIPRTGQTKVRPLVIMRNQLHDCPRCGPSTPLALDYLRACCRELADAIVCDTGMKEGLKRAQVLIKSGSIDLVVMTDVNRISRRADVSRAFFNLCLQHGVRVIAFEDGVDTETMHELPQSARQAMLASLAIPTVSY